MTGMDALTHAVEAYLNAPYHKADTKELCESAVSKIFNYLERACQEPENIAVRQNMLKASFEAGEAFTVACVGYVHAIGHGIGGIYHLSHGQCMATLLPLVLLDYGKAAYIIKARMQLMRDFGCYPAAHSAFLLNMGLETLALRMPKYCENAIKVAEVLKASDKVESVSYPALPGDSQYELYKKYLKGGSGVISFVIKGGRDAAIRFMDSLKLASNEVHVADIRTCVLHPASETHRQLTEEQLAAAGINAGMVRFSVGLENIDDILEDLNQALAAV